MDRYICIHGHFYQPPRENPWLEEVELQDSAYPYHDWNRRITAECYAPNAVSRILDDQGRIKQIVNNYAKISFDFGPTLLAWMEKKAPDVYQAILEADRVSQEILSGHGSAIAQAYNHMILPLATSRDKYTQVFWGIQDFEYRFGRKPEGMWIPETAVDLETLDVLAGLGIRYTILAPHQARRFRPIGGKEWKEVRGGKIDPTMTYSLRLPSGRNTVLFFYDGHISRAVAFERLLKKGEGFAHRLIESYSGRQIFPQLVHIATDGESYGHHHRFGDMALAYALHYIEANNLARITNYGEYLEKHPPAHEVEIFENTSWSCTHGIERWRSDCGCNSGKNPEWNQSWRTPLREALNWLRDRLAPAYEREGRQLLKDPWATRDDYIEVILDRSTEMIDRFVSNHAVRSLTEQEKVRVLKLLELQRHTMLMYTSCGWFFDELSGIETLQVLQYAGRALQLGQELFRDGLLENHFLNLLERAKSNLPEYINGRPIYEEFVKPFTANLTKAAAHYAVSSLFEKYTEHTRIYCYTAEQKDYHSSEVGRTKLAVGQVKLTSMITRESALLSFGVIHFGDQNLNCGIREFRGEKDYQDMVREVSETFARADYPEVIRTLDQHFGESTYSLKSLFRDEQQKILDLILESNLSEAEAIYRQLYESHAPLMKFFKDLSIPLPRAFSTTAEFVLNNSLHHAFEDEDLDLKRIDTLLEEARSEKVSLDTNTLEYALRHTIEGMAKRLFDNPTDLFILHKLDAALKLVISLPFKVNLWKVQNICYKLLQTVFPEFRNRAEQEDRNAREWIDQFIALGEKLSIRIE